MKRGSSLSQTLFKTLFKYSTSNTSGLASRVPYLLGVTREGGYTDDGVSWMQTRRGAGSHNDNALRAKEKSCIVACRLGNPELLTKGAEDMSSMNELCMNESLLVS